MPTYYRESSGALEDCHIFRSASMSAQTVNSTTMKKRATNRRGELKKRLSSRNVRKILG